MTINQRLATAAFVLGAVAVFAQPMRGSVATIDTRALGREMLRERDRVTPLVLADWLVRARPDIRLVDVRDASAYATYHIPGAEHIPVDALAEAPLQRTDTVVVYGEDGASAAQAWFLLRALGYRGVLMLDEGLQGWRTDVLFPTLSEGTTPFLAERNARLSSLAALFGGQPQQPGASPSAAPLPTPVMPTVAAPSLTGQPTASGGAKKKKKEGC